MPLPRDRGAGGGHVRAEVPGALAHGRGGKDLASFSVKAWRNGYASDAELDEALYRYQRWDRLRISDKLRDAVADAPEIGWVSRHAFFCDRDKEVCKLFDEAGRPLIWDNAHLTVWGYPLYARYVEARLAELGI